MAITGATRLENMMGSPPAMYNIYTTPCDWDQ